MKKFTIYNLQFTIRLFVLILYILHFTFYIPSVLALDSTPSSDIRAKLEELKKEIASKAAKLKQEISNRLKDKAYVGKIKTKSSSSLTLATISGPKIVSINQDTEFVSKVKTKQKFSQTSIKEEDYLAGLGDVDETGVLTAKKLVLLSALNLAVKTYLWGQIISISEKQITLKDKNSKSIAVSLPNPAAVRKTDFVILTGSLDKNDIFEAEFVYVIPQGGFLKPKSASRSASPSDLPRTF